jgi:hypothetical protein
MAGFCARIRTGSRNNRNNNKECRQDAGVTKSLRSPDEQRRSDLSYEGGGTAALKDGGYIHSKFAAVEAVIM